jgi:hypothetical protein
MMKLSDGYNGMKRKRSSDDSLSGPSLGSEVQATKHRNSIDPHLDVTSSSSHSKSVSETDSPVHLSEGLPERNLRKSSTADLPGNDLRQQIDTIPSIGLEESSGTLFNSSVRQIPRWIQTNAGSCRKYWRGDFIASDSFSSSPALLSKETGGTKIGDVKPVLSSPLGCVHSRVKADEEQGWKWMCDGFMKFLLRSKEVGSMEIIVEPVEAGVGKGTGGREYYGKRKGSIETSIAWSLLEWQPIV